MSVFRVTIRGGRNEVEYTIHERSHDNTAVEAAKEALTTYARHGHSSFPYNHGELSVEVEELEIESVTGSVASRDKDAK